MAWNSMLQCIGLVITLYGLHKLRCRLHRVIYARSGVIELN